MALPQLFFPSALFKELVALDFIHYFAALTHDYVIRALQHNISRRRLKLCEIVAYQSVLAPFKRLERGDHDTAQPRSLDLVIRYYCLRTQLHDGLRFWSTL